MQSLSDILATTQKGSSTGTVGGKTTFLDELGRGLDGLDGGGQEREAPARVDVPDLLERLVVEARAAPPRDDGVGRSIRGRPRRRRAGCGPATLPSQGREGMALLLQRWEGSEATSTRNPRHGGGVVGE
jgi:hypothetical protein